MPVRKTSDCVSATEWRQVVATGASPWIVPKQRFSVPKGRQVSVPQGSCRPFGTQRHSFFSGPRARARGYNMPSRWDLMAFFQRDSDRQAVN